MIGIIILLAILVVVFASITRYFAIEHHSNYEIIDSLVKENKKLKRNMRDVVAYANAMAYDNAQLRDQIRSLTITIETNDEVKEG